MLAVMTVAVKVDVAAAAAAAAAVGMLATILVLLVASLLTCSTVRQALDMKTAKDDQVVYGPKGACRTNIGHLK